MKDIPRSKPGQFLVELGYRNRHVFGSYQTAATYADRKRAEGVPASIWRALPSTGGWTLNTVR